MTRRSGRDLGWGPRVPQSSVLLQDIHPLRLEAGVTGASCPCPPGAHGLLARTDGTVASGVTCMW